MIHLPLNIEFCQTVSPVFVYIFLIFRLDSPDTHYSGLAYTIRTFIKIYNVPDIIVWNQ